MDCSEYIKLIMKHLSGSINPEEKKALNAWLEKDKENKKVLTLFTQIWNTKESGEEAVDLQSAWSKLSEKTGISLSFNDIRESTTVIRHLPLKRSKTKFAYQIMRYAAVFLVAFSLVYIFSKSDPQKFDEGQREISVQYGKQSSITLPDGSKVILDAGSTLRFTDAGFSDNKREVILNGEAYFEVRHNPLKPFVIYANSGIVTVLGTKFNVRSWNHLEDEVKVVVVDGKVSLRNQVQEKNSVVVVDKGKMSYLAAAHPRPSAPVKVDVETHLAWMKRELILDSTPLYDVLDRLSRWYDLQIRLPSPVYNNVRITGTFKKKSIDHILEAIGLMTQMGYKRNGKQVVFYKKKTGL